MERLSTPVKSDDHNRSGEQVYSAPEKKKKKNPSFKGEGNIDWISSTVIFLPPVLVLGAVLAGVPLQLNTTLTALVFYFINGFGVTVGYHRLFSHRAFTASPALQWLMVIWGAGAFEGSVKWWARNHRIHHRYVDTDKDPYNAKRGFWFTHVGWMLRKRDTGAYGHVDVSDLRSNPIVMFQHKNYLPMAVLSGIVAPTLVCGLFWGDWLGGYFYAALLKMFFTHQSTFFINSLAHTNFMGAVQNFSNNHTSHDSFFCAVLSLGEGYHNFHHEFAQDYRNGLRWYQYDPTKWFIRTCEAVGSATNLIRVPNDVIKKNIYETRHRNMEQDLQETEKKLKRLDDSLLQKRRSSTASSPQQQIMTWSEFHRRCEEDGQKLMVVGDYVLDIEKRITIGAGYTHKNSEMDWYANHPGGQKMLNCFVGKDATDAMSGGVYKHSQGSFNLVQHLRVAHIEKAKTI